MSPAHPAKASRARALVTPSGIEIWHVEDYTVPVVSMEFAFLGGAAQDPANATGLANLMASLLDEGAGDLPSEAFQEALEEKAIELNFDAGRDRVDGSLRTLAEHADAAFDMLALALQKPRFDPDAIDRVRAQIISGLKREETDPQAMARDALYRLAFPGHSYGRSADGRIGELAGINRETIRAQHRALLARDCLHIVAVGAISPEALVAGIEKAFGALPARAELADIPQAAMQGGGQREIIDLDVPQSTLYYALPGLSRQDPDFMIASVVNHILGGGSFTSRIWTEVREKRGLAYSVWSMLAPRQHAQLFIAGTATSNERVAESLSVIEAEIAAMAASGPTADELDKAKRYLAGSYALRFDTSRKIAAEFLQIRIDGLGIDYIDRRNDEVNGVSLVDAARVAARLLADARPLIVAAGRPIGLA